MTFRKHRIGVLIAAAWLALWSVAAPADEPAKPAAATVRPEVGKPINAARELIQARKYKEALAKLREAEAAPNPTAYERFVIDLTRGSAAQGAGDTETAITSFESVVAAQRLPPADQLRVIGAITDLYYEVKKYSKCISWAQRYEKEGGTDPAIRQALTQAYYLNGDYASAARLAREQIDADERAQRTPSEQRLLFLASCTLKTNDNAGYTWALERLVEHYPTKSYWADLISRVQRKPGFAERLELDVLRLDLAAGTLNKPQQYMVMAQLDLQAGFPAEAKKVLDQGYAAGVLGKGGDVERQNRLRDLTNRQAAQDAQSLGQGESESAEAKDGDALVAIGYNYVINGKADKGLPLMEQGLRKKPLKHPEDAKLHLGLAYAKVGQTSKAVQILQSVRGNDGTADLARLWIMQIERPSAAS